MSCQFERHYAPTYPFQWQAGAVDIIYNGVVVWDIGIT